MVECNTYVHTLTMNDARKCASAQRALLGVVPPPSLMHTAPFDSSMPARLWLPHPPCRLHPAGGGGDVVRSSASCVGDTRVRLRLRDGSWVPPEEGSHELATPGVMV